MRALGILFGRLGAQWEREQRDTLFLLTALFLCWIAHAQHLPFWVTVTTLLLMSYRAWLTVQGQPLPGRWLLWLLAFTLTLALLAQFRTLFGRDAGVAALVVLLALKLLEMRARRDVFVVLFIGFFLMLTNFLYSQSIPVALLMVFALLAIVLAQINVQFMDSEPPFAAKLKMAASLLAQAVPLMLVLFVLFPRIAGPLWALPKDAAGAKTGLSDTMAPGSVSELALSGELAFSVAFDQAVPPSAKLYWRGPVLETFDGRTWRRSDVAARMQKSLTLRIPADAAAIDYTVTLEASQKPWIFALEAPVQVPVLSQAGNEVRMGMDLQMTAQRPLSERVRYRARSQLNFSYGEELDAAQRAALIDLPYGMNPRTLKLATQWRAEESDAAQLLQRALRFYTSQPFRYSLTPPALGLHSVDEFLFDTQTGFCEHYASSFVVLMRALEIPARVVTGYQGGEINSVDGSLSVRQSDAHAWAEVWLAQRGWVRVDPTALVAPNRIERGVAGSVLDNAALPFLVRSDIDWLRRLRFNWEAVNHSWNQWVLSFNGERQRDLLQRLGLSDPDWRQLGALLLGMTGVVLGSVSAWLWWRTRTTDPLARLYSRYCTWLARRGAERLPHEGPQDFAQRAVRQLLRTQEVQPAQARLIEQGALLYASLRYQALARSEYQRKLRQLKTCIAALARF
ncbi:MAG: DUF3488 domain-containing protein [Burkholderiaceae bacterium]|nr:MAG: DUF3488 domain-containing protein [Burkholderiaceae bacterium]